MFSVFAHFIILIYFHRNNRIFCWTLMIWLLCGIVWERIVWLMMAQVQRRYMHIVWKIMFIYVNDESDILLNLCSCRWTMKTSVTLLLYALNKSAPNVVGFSAHPISWSLRRMRLGGLLFYPSIFMWCARWVSSCVFHLSFTLTGHSLYLFW